MSEVNIPLSQTATNPILLSSVSLLVSPTELTSVSMGDSNQSSLIPMPSSNVETMSTQLPDAVVLITNVSTSISILPSVESGKKIKLNISKSNLAYILFIFVLAERIINSYYKIGIKYYEFTH